MFAWWGRVVTRLRWAVLAVAVGVVALGATWGVGVFDTVSDGGFNNPDSPSQQAEERIEEEFGRQAVDVVVLYESADHTVDSPEFADKVTASLDEILDNDDVESITSFYDTGMPSLVSEDQHATFAAITLTGADEAERADQFAALEPQLHVDGIDTLIGGQSAIFDDINTQTQQDIITVELFTLPILLLLMIVIFGSLVAATTPLFIGILAIMGGLIITRLLTYVTDVSVFAINVITIIGLGLAIDYALFVVSRFREEMAAGREIPDAVVRTMTTAGRTVLVSGMTIILALAGLLLFPLPFLHGIAYGGMSAVAIAMLGSMSVLPALLAVLGHRVDAVRMPWRKPKKNVDHTVGFWATIGRGVMKRPLVFILASVAVLVGLATPFLHASFGGVDETVLPQGTESRVVAERLRDDFPDGDLNSFDVLLTDTDQATIAEAVAEFDGIEMVESVTPTAGSETAAVLRVGFDADAQSDEARDLATDIGAMNFSGDTELWVAGIPAQLNDQFSDIGDRLPWLALYVSVVTLLLLFLAFGSVLLPIKAILMNMISIGASFGVVVWIFQDGHLSNLFGFTATGYLEPSNLLLMVVLLFGLSTDYEVFLLSRVREEWDRTGDNTTAVLTGLQRTGGIISSAALLLIVVVGGFAAGGITFLKMIGIGMAVAIFIDATLVRMLLVPATMRVMGRANWWAPKSLSRFYAKYGVKEGDAESSPSEPELVSAGK
ncbi:RND superfamily putative drug exporter [Stackebrandtia endophytica]|uniref:RND superfamily putative drug exporter n=1 Tax=Stackebrandtia endophytica TaxID=1496996 RepID=A0A543B1P0_9ACTN|nr:MMPL family transporter [Stackebrandtia endophytica]TQL78726.1 RND superfamily putative drug exporter [Stackebrandtia endophytica]